MQKALKKQLITDFQFKYCKENSLKQTDFASAKINIDKYKLKADDLKLLKLTFKQASTTYDQQTIAIAVMSSDSNLDSWKRLYTASYSLNAEDILLDLNNL